MKMLALILLLLGLCTVAVADVSVSKSNTYSVLAPPDGAISISKSNVYAVLVTPSVGKRQPIIIMSQVDKQISLRGKQ